MQDVALDEIQPVPQPPGACFMLRRSVLGETLFDEQFPLLYNDVDLCRRLDKAGHRCYYLPEAKVNVFDTIESTPTPVIDRNVRHSVSAQYDFGKYTLRGGVINVTDEEPPVVGNEAGSTDFNSGNTFPGNYDTLGRMYTLQLNVSF